MKPDWSFVTAVSADVARPSKSKTSFRGWIFGRILVGIARTQSCWHPWSIGWSNVLGVVQLNDFLKLSASRPSNMNIAQVAPSTIGDGPSFLPRPSTDNFRWPRRQAPKRIWSEDKDLMIWVDAILAGANSSSLDNEYNAQKEFSAALPYISRIFWNSLLSCSPDSCRTLEYYGVSISETILCAQVLLWRLQESSLWCGVYMAILQRLSTGFRQNSLNRLWQRQTSSQLLHSWVGIHEH